MDRRDFLTTSLAVTTAASLPRLAGASIVASTAAQTPARTAPVAPPKLKQSVCRWCFSGMKLEELCEAAKNIGLSSVELLDENEWGTPAKYNLVCAIGNGPTRIHDGYTKPDNHDKFTAALATLIPKAAELGVPNIIVFSGNRNNMPDDVGLKNCAEGLRKITPIAEKHKVNLVMELLNSKLDHKDYMCDRTPWGAELVKSVNSERFKLLYDIYHMQIMEGDVIRTIRDYAPAIAHYHTAGVPGRQDLDDTQELFYPAICRAILETGFEGYFAQEFMPKGEPAAALRKAFETCNV